MAGAAGASITAYWLAQPVDIGWCKRYINNKCFGLSNLWLVQPVAKNTSQVGWFRRSTCRSKLKQDPVHAHWTNRLGWFSRTVGRCISTKLERWLVQPVTLLESTRCDCLRSMKQHLVRLLECVAGAAKNNTGWLVQPVALLDWKAAKSGTLQAECWANRLGWFSRTTIGRLMS